MNRITMQRINAYVAARLCNPRRKSNEAATVRARSYAIYLARTLVVTPLDRPPSFPEIGRWFGFHHSSVIYQYQKIRSLIETDAQVRAWLDEAAAAISADQTPEPEDAETRAIAWKREHRLLPGDHVEIARTVVDELVRRGVVQERTIQKAGAA